MAKSEGSGIGMMAVFAFSGAILGSLGTLIVQSVFPGPQPGDGFTVRWLSQDNKDVTSLQYGDDEKGALRKAVEIAQRLPGIDVTIIEVRQGIVRSIQRAGYAEEVM